MEKRLLKVLTIILIFALPPLSAFPQNGIRLRFAANTGMVVTEAGGSAIIADPYATYNEKPGGSTSFKPDITIGFEGELLIPVNNIIGLGLEFKNANFSGHNDNPIYYNYFASQYSPILNYGQEPLVYKTDVNNLLGNIRIFPLGRSAFSPFVKIYGGVAFIATDLRYKDTEYRVNIYDPLYSRGTSSSVTESSRYTAPNFGGGIGFEYAIAGNLSLNACISFSYINSDILDGIPNFTYDQSQGQSVYSNNSTITDGFSVGLSYAVHKLKHQGNEGTKRFGKGKTDMSLPFFRRR